MLSILIPCYNYDVSSLIKELKDQITDTNIPVEIICCDDASTDKIIQSKNKEFLKANKIVHFQNTKNIGRTSSRQLLAKKSNYDWLLLLDADVMPKNKIFLKTYISELQNNISCVYGGLCYQKEQPEKEYLLRWRFGHIREDISLSKRQELPYKSIGSGNLLIKKDLFLMINKDFSENRYGYDNIFSAQLEVTNSSISHINNKVFHLGLEDNTTYLIKKELATNTIYHLYKNNKFSKKNDNGLLNSYITLKKYKLTYLYHTFFRLFCKILKKNLVGNNPKLLFLDLYRLGYFCSLTFQKNA